MNKIIIIIVGALILLIGGVNYYSKETSKPLAEFAMCLDKAGAKFYGASWCPHCLEQKALFKGAKSSIPYVECAFKPNEAAKKTSDVMAQYRAGTYTGVYLEQIKLAEVAKKAWKAEQTEICVEKKIQGYPTWVFADGTTKNGVVKLKDLGEKTKCAVPESAKSEEKKSADGKPEIKGEAKPEVKVEIPVTIKK